MKLCCKLFWELVNILGFGSRIGVERNVFLLNLNDDGRCLMCGANLDAPYNAVSPAGPHDHSDRNLSKSASHRAGSNSSKTEILRISRGRLKDGDSLGSSHQSSLIDNKRKRNSSRENSLESLLEEEDQTSGDNASRESLGTPHD